MRSELVINTKSLGGSSDLTLLAPIRKGLVPSLESVTYKTRVKRVLKTLNTARSSSHEYALLRPFSDAVERVGRIQSVRVAVLEPEDKVLLAVTFDGAWESYIRVLWQKVGSLLDVIFCNTEMPGVGGSAPEAYPSACDHTFEVWLDWARRVQVETAFFYAMPGVTVADVHYLRGAEMLHREHPPRADVALAAARMQVRSVEELASAASGMPSAQWPSGVRGQMIETVRQALQALSFIYRLTDLYVPGEADGKHLRRAARNLLMEFMALRRIPAIEALVQQAAELRFGRQVAWLDTHVPEDRPLPPALPAAAPADSADVQGGIVRTYEKATHGCLMLMAFADAGKARQFINRIVDHVTKDSDPHELAVRSVAVNVAVTHEGLRLLGLTETQLAYFAGEFREGMEARASVLGDYRSNHPRRWRLPEGTGNGGTSPPQVELSAVHLVVQLRGRSAEEEATGELIDAFWQRVGGDRVEPLSIQPMRRHFKGNDVQEHFGFLDGGSEPRFDAPPAGAVYPNQIHLGEVLLGHANQADPAPDADDVPDQHAEAARAKLEWLRNGSYLVVRKLRQDVAALEQAVAVSGEPRELVLSKMMGRKIDGEPLVPRGADSNDFDYSADPSGAKCPFHAHIRRINPRSSNGTGPVPEPPGARMPRLVRRGMSYGPRYDLANPHNPGNAAERGLVFMTYNASIGEQFEVVQRWIAGGNSTNVLSGHNDPFCGVPENGQRRMFRYEDNGRIVNVALDGASALLGDPKPFVRLEWGMYLFAPSLKVLRRLAAAPKAPQVEPVWSVAAGLKQLDQLPVSPPLPPAARSAPAEPVVDVAGQEAWKAALEDPVANDEFVSASLLAAIRERDRGVLRTPYGVLVADRKLLMDVLKDDASYSVKGYHERMSGSIGEIYLGLDRSPSGNGPYEAQSRETNEAIKTKLTGEGSFHLARGLTTDVLGGFVKAASQQPLPNDPTRWDLNLDATEVTDRVLGLICQFWFGLKQKDAPIVYGRFRWDWKDTEPPTYPGHFTAPSRHLFQPHPGDSVEALGQRYGKALTVAMGNFLKPFREAGTVPLDPKGVPAPITEAIMKEFPDDDGLVARNVVGALMGFLPTVDGNLRLSLNEWLRDGTFWSLRAAMAKAAADEPHERARRLLTAPLHDAMMLRPSPAMIWRRATKTTTLGGCPVAAGDVVALSIASATQQCLETVGREPGDIHTVFGGDRSQPGHPTHACPAYDAAIGVMLGILSAFLEVKESMRPSAAPLAFTFEGQIPTGP